MILGIGTDLVAVDRIARALERHGERLLDRILAPAERAAMPGNASAAWLAKRFAAKEAAMKAIGTGLAAGVRFHDFEIRRHPTGRPELVLSESIRVRLGGGDIRAHLSIADERDHALAFVVIEGMRDHKR